ncbi:Peptidyl-prolyl cis-trans isomerase cyp15 [Coemansia thaxteri]|uniref:peptidylprolyl isomerase n=1 Tax=Coemansia thaxteri TaxID=2663907 RepID=A0A9W8EEA6_9FUNG|nr:Peptidyl-prolyl cis-trans isomerase cyp15 [Coemansia thaxteri]
MHRDTIEHVVVAKAGFVITISADGHLKFWKMSASGIEFVKDFRAHLGAIIAYTLSPDGQLFATSSTDKMIKIFDVVNFDMIGMFDVGCVPSALCWIRDSLDQSTCIAVADSINPSIFIFDYHASSEPKRTISEIHQQPVVLMEYNAAYECVISIDAGGMIEYWSVNEPQKLPPTVEFSLKSQTDLYEFKKCKCVPNSLVLSPDYEMFSCTCVGDSAIRVFSVSTGKLYRVYNESIGAISKIQHNSEGGEFKLEDMEFGRRLAVENELLKSPAGKRTNAIFDESATFLMFASLVGVKVVNLVTNKVVRVLGKSEPCRFVNLALIQGVPDIASSRLDMAASSNSGARQASNTPTLFCTAFGRNRFFMFTSNEPDHSSQELDRDVFNERPTREEASLAVVPTKRQVVKSAVLRTTLGDIHFSLFPQHAPKAVENFVSHSQSGYFNGVIFHRVIKRFMIQTGDPLGDGTGGESIWGKAFGDEFTPKLRHDRPYTVSMANAGANSNGSQFFITTADAAPWLDDKHTIFGRVTAGTDVVHLIESTKTDKRDKPIDDIQILNVQINFEGT